MSDNMINLVIERGNELCKPRSIGNGAEKLGKGKNGSEVYLALHDVCWLKGMYAAVT